METIFLILSGVVLFAGVMYWMWSHLQLTQKKVQLLENAVFELRAMIPGNGTAGPPAGAPAPAVVTAGGAAAAAGTSRTYNDLADDDWEVQAHFEPVPEKSTPLDAVGSANTPANTPELVTRDLEVDGELSDLMPGGRAGGVPMEEGVEVQEVELTEKKFKELFASRLAATEVPASSSAAAAPTAASLEGMPLKELRRLGDQRGIRGASEMRKKELLAALRSQVAAPAAAQEEKTLDLEAVEAATGEIVEPVAEEAEILE